MRITKLKNKNKTKNKTQQTFLTEVRCFDYTARLGILPSGTVAFLRRAMQGPLCLPSRVIQRFTYLSLLWQPYSLPMCFDRCTGFQH